ncbi:unnamed protein product [Gadus morhua 'NCC']
MASNAHHFSGAERQPPGGGGAVPGGHRGPGPSLLANESVLMRGLVVRSHSNQISISFRSDRGQGRSGFVILRYQGVEETDGREDGCPLGVINIYCTGCRHVPAGYVMDGGVVSASAPPAHKDGNMDVVQDVGHVASSKHRRRSVLRRKEGRVMASMTERLRHIHATAARGGQRRYFNSSFVLSWRRPAALRRDVISGSVCRPAGGLAYVCSSGDRYRGKRS